MPDTTSEIRGRSATVVSGDGAVMVATDDHGAIITGVIVTSRGAHLGKSRAFAGAILGSTAGAPARPQAQEGHRPGCCRAAERAMQVHL
jgi:hypothetical protein